MAISIVGCRADGYNAAKQVEFLYPSERILLGQSINMQISNLDIITLRPEIQFSRKKVKEICDRWRIIELACFGSVLRNDFNLDSDVDFLVSFAEDAKITFFDLDDIEGELSKLVNNRSVDVITRHSIEKSHNPIRRSNILDHSYVFYRR